MANRELLLTLSRENERQRDSASQSVERGMEALVGTKRVIQKLSRLMDDEHKEMIANASLAMVNSGIALRVMLQCHDKHHQRQEAPWVDPEGSTGKLLRSALAFEDDAETFARQLRKALQQARSEAQAERQPKSSPDHGMNWAPSSPSAPSIE